MSLFTEILVDVCLIIFIVSTISKLELKKGEINKDFYGNVLKPFTEVIRHPIAPDEEEIERNSRSRSAKLRIAVRNDGE